MKKTPTPEELLLEPPKIYTKLASIPPIGRVLLRGYGTASRIERFRAAYNNNKKEFWGAALGVATVSY